MRRWKRWPLSRTNRPVTRAEMEMIRGVDVAAPLERLLERGLVRVLGKRDTIGRPMVYGTTDEFFAPVRPEQDFGTAGPAGVLPPNRCRRSRKICLLMKKLPPLGEPAILALEEETGDAADASL